MKDDEVTKKYLNFNESKCDDENFGSSKSFFFCFKSYFFVTRTQVKVKKTFTIKND